ncbi:MAG: universal stress protein [Solirubrobacteraceae bacterium]
MILIAYDGSADAQAAIGQAGALFRGEPATILTVWEPFLDVMARTGAGLGLASGIVDSEEIDEAYERSARERAGEGVERAQRAGLNDQPRSRTRHTTIAEAILAEADEVGARAIVLGTRGLTGIRSLLLGSVSHAVLQHADRPVIVVPSAQVAKERAAHRR